MIEFVEYVQNWVADWGVWVCVVLGVAIFMICPKSPDELSAWRGLVLQIVEDCHLDYALAWKWVYVGISILYSVIVVVLAPFAFVVLLFVWSRFGFAGAAAAAIGIVMGWAWISWKVAACVVGRDSSLRLANGLFLLGLSKPGCCAHCGYTLAEGAAQCPECCWQAPDNE